MLRLGLEMMDSHRIRARRDASESTNAQSVNESGCPATVGPTWGKIASSAK